MWIDADIGLEADAVQRLLAHNEPIVAATYPQKGRRTLTCHVLPDTEKLVFGEQGGLIEVLYAGTGFLLVRRAVYEAMQRQLELPVCNERFPGPSLVPYFLPLIREDGPGHWYLAEDFAFCERARRCDYKIMVDTTIRLRHYVNEANEEVTIILVGEKRGNSLFVQGEEFTGHESDPAE
ncbi:MAG TPA: hypothetical protein VMM76_20220 [Pirellulaceae bacterium]|nr:hypothetical protein [Pirellulaceae bacterium]